MRRRNKRLSDLARNSKGNVLILEDRSVNERYLPARNTVHLSGVVRRVTWRMRLSDALLSLSFIRRSFESLLYGRSKPIDLRKPTRHATPAENSMLYWVARPVLDFAGIVLILVLSGTVGVALYNGSTAARMVMSNSQTGVNALRSAKEHIFSFNFALAADDFESANRSFSEIRNSLQDISRSVHLLSVSPLASGDRLLTAGEKLSQAGNDFARAIAAFQESLSFADTIAPFETGYQNLTEAVHTLETVDTASLPESIAAPVAEARTALSSITAFATDLHLALPDFQQALGFTAPAHYLLIFQNTAERRGAGGFMGSFATLTVERGSIAGLEPDDIYRVDWCMKPGVQLPQAPAGLQQHISSFHMRDANYSPDFPTSAKWLLWFAENLCSGKKMDGVIAIDDTMLRDILAITGPISLPEYGVTISKENYFEVLQLFIETSKEDSRIVQDDGRYGTPKQILLDLVPKIQAAALLPEHNRELADLLLSSAETKHLQAYFNAPTLQSFSEKFGVSGSIVQDTGDYDYLNIVDMNIGGNKSDRFLDESIKHLTRVSDTGVVTDTLTLRRTHTFSDEMLRTIRSRFPAAAKNLTAAQLAQAEFVLGNGPNTSFTRIMVPAGSILLSASGISVNEISKDAEVGKDIFSFTWELQPGESREVQLTYVLPHVLDLANTDTYRLVAQKQAGTQAIPFTKILQLDPGVVIARDYPAHTDGESETITSETTLERDRYFINVLATQ